MSSKNKVTLMGLMSSAATVIQAEKQIGEITIDSHSSQLYKVALLEQLLINEKTKALYDMQQINLHAITEDIKQGSEKDKRDGLKTAENIKTLTRQKVREVETKGNQFSVNQGVSKKEYVDDHYAAVSEIVGSAVDLIQDVINSKIDYKSIKTALLLDTGQDKAAPDYVFNDGKFRLVFSD